MVCPSFRKAFSSDEREYGKEEIIDVANLPQSEHYKMLYPRVIHHNLKKLQKKICLN